MESQKKKEPSKSDDRDFLKIQFEMLIIHFKNKLNFMELPTKHLILYS